MGGVEATHDRNWWAAPTSSGRMSRRPQTEETGHMDANLLPRNVAKALGPDGAEYTDEQIAEMGARTVFDEWLAWEGIIGWTETILDTAREMGVVALDLLPPMEQSEEFSEILQLMEQGAERLAKRCETHDVDSSRWRLLARVLRMARKIADGQ